MDDKPNHSLMERFKEKNRVSWFNFEPFKVTEKRTSKNIKLNWPREISRTMTSWALYRTRKKIKIPSKVMVIKNLMLLVKVRDTYQSMCWGLKLMVVKTIHSFGIRWFLKKKKFQENPPNPL